MATTNTLTGSSQADILNAPGSSVTLVEGLAGNDTITLSKINDEAEGGEVLLSFTLLQQASNVLLMAVLETTLSTSVLPLPSVEQSTWALVPTLLQSVPTPMF